MASSIGNNVRVIAICHDGGTPDPSHGQLISRSNCQQLLFALARNDGRTPKVESGFRQARDFQTCGVDYFSAEQVFSCFVTTLSPSGLPDGSVLAAFRPAWEIGRA